MNNSELDPQIGTWSRVVKRDRPSESKRFHYEWCFDDGQCGFVVHKKNGKGYKMFLDSNEDGIFDSSDELIVKGPFKEGFESVKPGRLLGKEDEGIITAEPYSAEDHEGHDHGHDHEGHDHDHDHDHGHHDKVEAKGINGLGIQHMSFLNTDLEQVLHDHGDAHNAHHEGMM